MARSISAAEPVLVVVFAWVLLRQRLPRRLIVPMIAVLGGTAVVVTSNATSSGSGWLGDLLVALGIGCASLYVVGSSRVVDDVSPLGLTLLQQLVGIALVIPVAGISLLVGGMGSQMPTSVWPWLAVPVIGIASSSLTFWLYLTSLRHLPAGTTAQFMALIPVVAFAGAVLVLDEPTSGSALLGAAAVVAALLVIAHGEHRAAALPDAARDTRCRAGTCRRRSRVRGLSPPPISTLSRVPPLTRIDRPSAAVAVLTLDRPDRRNALSVALRDEIVDRLQVLAADEELKVVVLTGAGEVFCAGFDLKEFDRGFADPAFMDELWASSDRYHHAVAEFPLITIAAVNGPAVAGGFDLAILCDLRVAATTATFSHPEYTFGEVVYGPLHALVGGALARDLCLTGRVLSASEALDARLTSSVVEPDEVLPAALELAERVALGPRAALMRTKAKALARSGVLGVDGTLDL